MSYIRPEHSPIVRQHAIDLALDIRRLRPYATAARKHVNLLPKLVQKEVTSISPGFQCRVDLICLVDSIDRFLDVPQMLDRDIISNATELALDANATWIVRTGLD